MLSRRKVKSVENLLEDGRSIEYIAQRLRCSPLEINSIKEGTHVQQNPILRSYKPVTVNKPKPLDKPQPTSRCPKCGGRINSLPCYLCYMKDYLQEN